MMPEKGSVWQVKSSNSCSLNLVPIQNWTCPACSTIDLSHPRLPQTAHRLIPSSRGLPQRLGQSTDCPGLVYDRAVPWGDASHRKCSIRRPSAHCHGPFDQGQTWGPWCCSTTTTSTWRPCPCHAAIERPALVPEASAAALSADARPAYLLAAADPSSSHFAWAARGPHRP